MLFRRLLFILFLPLTALSQAPGDFTIGMFGVMWNNERDGMPCLHSLDEQGYPTSSLNVLREDGFNRFSAYMPDWWNKPEYFKRLLLLADQQHMQIMTNAMDWYKPSRDTLARGVNIYNATNGSRTNLDYYFSQVYSDPEYRHIIWGHQLTEESAAWNYHNPSDSPRGAPGWYRLDLEVPLENVLMALDHFRPVMDTSQRMVCMEAHHSQGFTSNLRIDEENNNPAKPYTPVDLLNKLPRDVVFLEGSYMRFPENGSWRWQSYSDIFGRGPYTYHYLGWLKSIDFALTRVNEVHDVLSADMTYIEYLDCFNSSGNHNGNYLWFKVYADIIHGVDGIWFWDLQQAYAPQEQSKRKSTRPDRFSGNNFPWVYKTYIRHVVREVSYLSSQGFLSGADSVVLYTKTDHADTVGIIPPASEYIPLLRVRGEKRTENYGLRCTVRTNGKEVLVIVANPLNIKLKEVRIDLSRLGHPLIKEATRAEFLFADGTLPGARGYKEKRETVTREDGTTTLTSYYRDFTGTLLLDFGPMDVHVIRLTRQ